jgi:hypothetical protein
MSTWRTSALRSVVAVCAVVAVICAITGSWLGLVTVVLVGITPLVILRQHRRNPTRR